jgi:hypothetical protein
MGHPVVREWRGEHRFVVVVESEHPQHGTLLRGWIRSMPSPDWRSAWHVKDYDGETVGDGVFVGDYLDAERALLDATTAMEEE